MLPNHTNVHRARREELLDVLVEALFRQLATAAPRVAPTVPEPARSAPFHDPAPVRRRPVR